MREIVAKTLEEAMLILQIYPEGSCYIDGMVDNLVVVMFNEEWVYARTRTV